MKTWLFDLIQNFFIGGFITATISFTANFFSPVIAAILWAFPLSILPSMYYLRTQGKDNKYLAKFAYITTYALIILFFTTMALGYFYQHETTSFWIPVAKTVVGYIILSVIYYFSIQKLGLVKEFTN